ncbi:TIGR03016 family PEP-CTERM system-associated outer membrane protein [Salinisphaera aquimarina]
MLMVVALSAMIWPFDRAVGQETDSAAAAAPEGVVPTSTSSDSGQSTVGVDEGGANPLQTESSRTFDFISGFRGDCQSYFSSDLTGGPAAPLPVLSGPRRSAGRYTQLSLTASETYTDNLNRDPSDQAVSDFITEISPRLDACASTGRVHGRLSYSPQFVLYAHNSEFNDIYNTVEGETTVDLWAGHLYLDADTRYGQTVVDPSISFSQSNSLSPRNQTATWSSNISPYAIQSLGPVGTALLRYRYGKVLYNDNDVPDSTINAAYLNITSPPDRGRLSWTADVQTQKVERSGGDARQFFRGFDNVDPDQPLFDDVDNDNSDTSYFDRASLELGYQLSRTLTILAQGGVEDDYKDDGTNDRLSQPFYSGGFRWASGYNTLEAHVGHRFYGQSYSASVSHDGPVADASISYDEQATSAGLNALNGNGFGTGSIPGASLSGPVESRFDRGVFVEKRVTGRVGIDMARTSTGLTVYRRVRNYQSGDASDETYNGASVETRYQVTPRTSLIPAVRWQNRESNGDNTDFGGGYNDYETGVTLARAVSRSSQAAVGYAHAWRNGERRNSDYKENRVTLQFFKNF